MPTIETGLFLTVVVLSFIFTFGAFRASGYVKGLGHIVAVSLFMIISVWVLSGDSVATTQTSQDSTALVNNTDGSLILIQTNNTTITPLLAGGEETSWFGWVFVGFGFLNLIMFVKDVWQGS